MDWIIDLRSFIDMLSYVAAYGPDEFPDEDGESLSLQTAFQELRKGLNVIEPELRNLQLSTVEAVLQQAEENFRQKDLRAASTALVQLADSLEKG